MACQVHELRRQDTVSFFDLWRGIIQSTCSCVLTLRLPTFALPLRSSRFLPRQHGRRERGRLAGRGAKVWNENPDEDNLKCNRQVVVWRKDEPKDGSIEVISGDIMHLSNLYQGNEIFLCMWRERVQEPSEVFRKILFADASEKRRRKGLSQLWASQTLISLRVFFVECASFGMIGADCVGSAWSTDGRGKQIETQSFTACILDSWKREWWHATMPPSTDQTAHTKGEYYTVHVAIGICDWYWSAETWRREIEWNVSDIAEEFGLYSCIAIVMKDVDKTDYFATVYCILHRFVCWCNCCRSPLEICRSACFEMEVWYHQSWFHAFSRWDIYWKNSYKTSIFCMCPLRGPFYLKNYFWPKSRVEIERMMPILWYGIRDADFKSVPIFASNMPCH